MLSHTYIKKINLALPVEMSKNKNLEILCVVPKKIYQGSNIIYPDYKLRDFKIKLIKSNLNFSENIQQLIFYLTVLLLQTLLFQQ